MDLALANLRMEIGDTKSDKIFTDCELEYFLNTSNNDMTLAKIKVIDRLIIDNHKLHKFSLGNMSGDPASIITHLISWRRELVLDTQNNKSHSSIYKV